MSYRKEKNKSLIGLNYSQYSSEKLQTLCSTVLENGMHGLCFSPYEEGQKPGDPITEAQIRRRLEIIAPYTKWIRSFSCTEGNDLIPKLAKEYGLKTLVGAWLGDDKTTNDKEIKALIKLSKDGFVDIAAVGNEVMYRGDLSEIELLNHIQDFKTAVPNVEVGYVDAYYEFTDRPKITEACDVILANCYPYWEECHMNYSLLYMKQMYQQALRAGQGKKVIITETGWPSQGSDLGVSHPSHDNALKYFINAQLWSDQDQIEMFYFSSFDESWKVGSEGDVGAFWGLWDKNEKLKF
ncbi:glycosyl hydrolase family 17 protein [Flavobacteriaceae bacterium]|jgi:glucan 1,3-beta-glucosidase|nr:glycosyl hydrolase family 17 protein [Flavobacteriaceae bacterium]MDC0463566.1 glycosyl hydrolase family 17 protein [Flavobacteriaceae bacterium]MDC3350816.1 glycosyl hydrolase family 17 protein [Flavobacteriaceae bacterium]